MGIVTICVKRNLERQALKAYFVLKRSNFRRLAYIKKVKVL